MNGVTSVERDRHTACRDAAVIDSNLESLSSQFLQVRARRGKFRRSDPAVPVRVDRDQRLDVETRESKVRGETLSFESELG